MAHAAKVIDTHKPDDDDPIVAEYRELSQLVDQQQAQYDFWKNTLEHPVFMDYLDDLDRRRAAERELWDTIPPKDFAASQNRFMAFGQMLKELMDKDTTARAELNKRKARRYDFELRNELFLQKAGIEFDKAEAQKAVEEAGGQAVAAQGEQPLGLIVRFTAAPADPDIVKRLKSFDFAQSADDDLLYFHRNPTDKARAFLKKNQGETLAVEAVHIPAEDGDEADEQAENEEAQTE